MLRQLGEGFSNAEIAERVVIRPRTAEHHLGRTLPRLELKRRALVAAFALSEFRCTRGVERGDLPMKSGWCRGTIALQPEGVRMERRAAAESPVAGSRVALREIAAGDAEACARICFEAFGAIHDQHRFPRDFPVLEMATGMFGALTYDPSVWGVVAEVDGGVVGSNFLYEGNLIAGVGPISVDPEYQRGVGRRLMEAVIERGREAPGIRLVQDAFNMRSLSLYASVGFDVKEPLAVVSGKPRSGPAEHMEVRPLREDDLDACGGLCREVHGFARVRRRSAV